MMGPRGPGQRNISLQELEKKLGESWSQSAFMGLDRAKKYDWRIVVPMKSLDWLCPAAMTDTVFPIKILSEPVGPSISQVEYFNASDESKRSLSSQHLVHGVAKLLGTTAAAVASMLLALPTNAMLAMVDAEFNEEKRGLALYLTEVLAIRAGLEATNRYNRVVFEKALREREDRGGREGDRRDNRRGKTRKVDAGH